MSLLSAKGTLGFYSSSIIKTHRSIKDVPARSLAERLDKYYSDSATLPAPEGEALKFYYLNHAFSELQNKFLPDEPLDEKCIELLDYHDRLVSDSAVRMFYYLFVICIRETRHLGGYSAISPNLVKNWGKDAADIVQSIPDNSSQAMKMAATPSKFKNNVKIGDICGALVQSFYEGSWGGGFGGTAWGGIADVLYKFVIGEYTAEMMLDTAFTLCHNNGPIFNKGMLYKTYGNQIYKILDIQRSGQIPQLIESETVVLLFLDQEDITPIRNLAKEVIGGPFKESSYVDYYMVEAMGSLHKYPSEKELQIKKYVPPHLTTKEEETKVQIMPGVFVPKVEVKRDEEDDSEMLQWA